jgi:hypothetical protein
MSPASLTSQITAAVKQHGVWEAPGKQRRSISAAAVAEILCLAPAELKAGRSITLKGLQVEQEIDLTAGELLVAVTLIDCGIPGLKLADATTRTLTLDDCDLVGVDLARATVHGALWITTSRITGTCVLRQATVDQTVNLSGTCVGGTAAGAIDGDRLEVAGSMFLRDGFETQKGGVRLRGAQIKGQLGCEGANIVSDDRALDLGDAHVGRMILLAGRPEQAPEPARPFRAVGEIRLAGATVGGDVVVVDARITASSAPKRNGDPVLAVNANALVAAANVYVGDDVVVQGEIRMIGAKVGRDLTCRGVRLLHCGGVALDLSRTTVEGRFEYRPSDVQGTIRLCHATVGRLEDDIRTWPSARGDLDLEGLAYTSLGSVAGTPVADREGRLAWLAGQRYRPQPYEQLMAFYRRDGRDQDARSVGLAKQRRRRASLPWWQRPWGYVLDGLLGYGYYPAFALVWLGLLLVVGIFLFAHLHSADALQGRGGTTPQPDFSAPLYTLDLLLPVISLKQRDAWVAVSHGAQAASAIYIALGWIIGSAVVAALAGLVRRE